MLILSLFSLFVKCFLFSVLSILFIFEAFCLKFLFNPNNPWSIKSAAPLRYHCYSFKVQRTGFQSEKDAWCFLLSKWGTFRVNQSLWSSIWPKILPAYRRLKIWLKQTFSVLRSRQFSKSVAGKTGKCEEQIMFKDKLLTGHIFAPSGGYFPY